jgi:AraC-like DNA-binding protein
MDSKMIDFAAKEILMFSAAIILLYLIVIIRIWFTKRSEEKEVLCCKVETSPPNGMGMDIVPKRWGSPADQDPFIQIDPLSGGLKRNRHKMTAPSRVRILRGLRRLMEEKCIYRQKGISLDHLAKILGTNRTYLSVVIGDEFGMNFTCLINRYRIEEAVGLLSDRSNKMPIKVIAEYLGYKSLSTFYCSFKKIVKTSPSQFRKLSRTARLKEDKKSLIMEEISG